MKTPTFNPILTQHSSEFAQKQDAYIASRLFPAFPVGAQAADYPVFKKENLLNVPKIKARAPGTPYQRINLEFGKDTYSTQDYGSAIPIDDRQQKIYANLLQSQKAKTVTLSRAMIINKEWRAKDKIYDPAIAIPTSAASTAWSDSNADIIEEVKLIRTTIFENCGMLPNIVTMPLAVWNYVSNHPSIVDRLKYTSSGSVTTAMVAALFEIDEIVISMSNVNEATEGQPISTGSIWNNDVIFAYVDSSMDMDSPSLGRTFVWAGNSPASGEVVMKTHRDDENQSWITTAMHDVAEKVQAPACGYILTGVIA